MRIIKETTVGEFKVTIFFWNNKYLLKYEDGFNEMTFKINQMDIVSEDDIGLFLRDEELEKKVREAFDKMSEVMQAFYNKI